MFIFEIEEFKVGYLSGQKNNLEFLPRYITKYLVRLAVSMVTGFIEDFTLYKLLTISLLLRNKKLVTSFLLCGI
jgi:hypothetical protein